MRHGARLGLVIVSAIGVGAWAAGCSGQSPRGQPDAAPATPAASATLAPSAQDIRIPDAVAGWTASAPAAIYDPESIYSYIDGHAEVYRAYGMKRCVSRRLTGPAASRTSWPTSSSSRHPRMPTACSRTTATANLPASAAIRCSAMGGCRSGKAPTSSRSSPRATASVRARRCWRLGARSRACSPTPAAPRPSSPSCRPRGWTRGRSGSCGTRRSSTRTCSCRTTTCWG